MNAVIKSYGLLALMMWKRILLASLPAGISRWKSSKPRMEIAGEPPYQATWVEGERRRVVEPEELRSRSVRAAQLVPASGSVLRRTATFPVAAFSDLDKILKLDLPVSTPFELDEVLLTHRLLGPPRLGKLTVDIAMVQRSHIQIALEAIRQRYGSSPAKLMLSPGRSIEIDEAVTSKREAAFRMDMLLALLAVTLVILVVWTAQNRQEERIQAVRLQVSRSLAGIENVAHMRKQIEVQRQVEGFLNNKRAEAPSMLALLNALGASLPQDVSLDALTEEDGAFSASFSGRDVPLKTSQVEGIASNILQPGYKLSTSGDSQTVTMAGKLRSQVGVSP